MCPVLALFSRVRSSSPLQINCNFCFGCGCQWHCKTIWLIVKYYRRLAIRSYEWLFSFLNVDFVGSIYITFRWRLGGKWSESSTYVWASDTNYSSSNNRNDDNVDNHNISNNNNDRCLPYDRTFIGRELHTHRHTHTHTHTRFFHILLLRSVKPR